MEMATRSLSQLSKLRRIERLPMSRARVLRRAEDFRQWVREHCKLSEKKVLILVKD
jgi:hypothetical protein